MQYDNLDTIISVGYRVNSQKVLKFRFWATNVLRLSTKMIQELEERV